MSLYRITDRAHELERKLSFWRGMTLWLAGLLFCLVAFLIVNGWS